MLDWTFSSEITFQASATKNISSTTLQTICDLERDMWARKEGLWEYMVCEKCESIFSKQDIYTQLQKDEYSLTVWELETTGFSRIKKCCNCRGDLRYYLDPKEYIHHVKERYASQTHLVLMKKWTEIVWFMDWYFWDFDTIFQREFMNHYGNIWLDSLKTSICGSLNEIIPEKIFSCTSLGTRESYMNFFNTYYLLQSFFWNFPQEEEWCLWIAEVHIGGTLDRLYSSLWAQKIDIENSVSINNTSPSYKSWIFIQKELGRTYKQWFSVDPRSFLRRNGVKKK